MDAEMVNECADERLEDFISFLALHLHQLLTEAVPEVKGYLSHLEREGEWFQQDTE